MLHISREFQELFGLLPRFKTPKQLACSLDLFYDYLIMTNVPIIKLYLTKYYSQ